MEGENEVVVRFMSHTPYAGLEQEMQHIPGFRPRRSGMVVSQLPDDTKKQDCLRGHISDGCIPFHKLLEVIGRGGSCQPVCEACKPFDRHERALLFPEWS